ncbi:GntR family transcriptional regulator [Geobacillus stearothermophilus]|nr:GntR family transcriptional regulator [Geobacillus stearothermophilus]
MKEKTLPKYLQLKQEILSWIISGQMKPDEKIPTEHEIANQFQLSRHTVRQALGELEKEGWLYKIQGSGTFVSRPKPKEQVDTKTIGIVTTYETGSSLVRPITWRTSNEIPCWAKKCCASR